MVGSNADFEIMNNLETDVLIIGAGPAGAIAAALLHREKIRVLVVEKQAFPRFVIGESMLPVSMNLLANAGLLDAVQRLVNRRRYQPDDEERLRRQIREKFPESGV